MDHAGDHVQEPVASITDRSASIDRAVRRLNRLAFWARVMLITHRLGWIVAGAVAMLVMMAVVDYFLRWPGWLRTGMLAVTLAVVALAVWRRLAPALRFRPTLTQVALRVEQTKGAQDAGLADVLASAIELASSKDDSAEARALARPVIAQAAKRLDSMSVRGVLRARPAMRSAGVAALAVAACLSLVVAQPRLSMIGVRRVLLPLSGAEWPKRTMVADATVGGVHPLGTAFSLRAALVKSSGGADETPVMAHYRVVGGPNAGTERTVALTSQNRPVTADALDELGQPARVTGTLMERLLEPAAIEARDADAKKPAVDSLTLEYWFTSEDDRTETKRVRLITPPAVAEARLIVTPPAYVEGGPLAQTRTMDLGAGTDQRAAAGDVLEGAELSLSLRFNKPVPAINAGDEMSVGVALGKDLGLLTGRPGAVRIECAEQEWTVRFKAGAEPVRVAVNLTDSFGVSSVEEAVFRVGVTRDKPPEAVVLTPQRDDDVLADARIEITGEARDDVALTGAKLQHQLARRPGGSAGAPHEAAGEQVTMQSVDPVATKAERSVRLAGALTPLELGAAPGDEVWVSVLASDAFSLEGRRHDAVRSAVRRLRVISREQLIEQLYTELAGVRRQAQRAAEQQQKVIEATQRAEAGQASPQAQAEVSEQVQRIQRALDDVQKRAEAATKSRDAQGKETAQPLGDRQLEEIMQQADRLAERAQEASDEAMKAMEAARAAARQEQPRDAASERSRAGQEQAKSKDALEQLTAALDRGQDAMSQRLKVQQLLNEQRDARNKTNELGRQTAGKQPEQLTAQQREQAEQLSRQQESLARRAEELARSMEQKAQELKQQDPEAADALRDAAKTAQRENLNEKMQEAANQIKRNQQQGAQENQQQAEQAMQQMLDQMNEAQKNRDATLRRELASLIQTLKGLVARQKGEIDALAAAGENTDALAKLDTGMIRLHGSTLAATDQAGAMGQKAAGVGELLAQAAERQNGAIGALRARPVQSAAAQQAEDDALARLNDALTLAQKLQNEAQQRERTQQRAELKAAYQKLLQTQNDLSAQSGEVVGAEVDRRTRNLARQIADGQDGVASEAADLPKKHEEITQSPVFTMAHERIGESSAEASRLLREASLTPLVTTRQAAVARTLQSLIDALDDAQKMDDEFRAPDEGNQQNNDGGEDEQGQQQRQNMLPPISQLKLLRQLQADALALTRQAQAQAGTPEQARAIAADAAKLQSRLAAEAKKIIEMLEQMGGGGGR